MITLGSIWVPQALRERGRRLRIPG
jgi:hypothetical protein